ncbi:hypothetical protein C1878_04210 [Gordonibacter sp. 28C]|uniref:winged helix-turn-helix domain-containing protein n=1 Tax=Gordonibacter sp. 28C TaxID=2078569 RepID=UPI000DF7AEB4|nr:winged helix-turn-helix domain-containing protein [Gordonibacter sp. 28C]RDB63995.1 hypothetical protein C1878_04210 [Gordonibacter sp. 28C]
MEDETPSIKDSIPDVETIKESVLSVLSSGRQRSVESLEQEVARHLSLSSKQKRYCVAGSKTTLFANRFEKARTELHKNKLIEYPHHGKVKLCPSEMDRADSSAKSVRDALPDAIRSKEPNSVSIDPDAKDPRDVPENPSTKESERASGTAPAGKGSAAAFKTADRDSGEKNAKRSTVPSSARKTSTAGNPSKLPILLAVAGLVLCFTFVLAAPGMLCGIAALALRWRDSKGTAKPVAPKATAILGGCAIALGAIIAIGGMSAGGGHSAGQNPPDAKSGQAIEQAAEKAEGVLSFKVEGDAEATLPSSVKIVVTGKQGDGTPVNETREAALGKTYALACPSGSYTFTVASSSLVVGDTFFKASNPSYSFDGKRDHTVSVTLKLDDEAMRAAQMAKEAAVQKKAAEEAAAAKAAEDEAAAAAAAEANAAAAASADDDSGYTVYVTNTGGKYHANGCQYLKKSKIPISISDAIAQGYEPCSRCNP